MEATARRMAQSLREKVVLGIVQPDVKTFNFSRTLRATVVIGGRYGQTRRDLPIVPVRHHARPL